MLAVYVNCIAVLIGSLIGVLCSKIVSTKISDIIKGGAGTVTLVLGVQMAFSQVNVVYLSISVIAGGLLGSWLNIEGAILSLGNALGKIIPKKHSSQKSLETKVASKTPDSEIKDTSNLKGPTVPEKSIGVGFLNASVLFCVGAMAIVGSINAGINSDYTVIFTKSVLDFFLAIVFGATLGVGTAFSTISIFLYQGLLTLGASFLKQYVSDSMISSLSAVGGILLVMIGFGLLQIKDMKTANYLPALVLIAVFMILDPYIMNIVNLFV